MDMLIKTTASVMVLGLVIAWIVSVVLSYRSPQKLHSRIKEAWPDAPNTSDSRVLSAAWNLREIGRRQEANKRNAREQRRYGLAKAAMQGFISSPKLHGEKYSTIAEHSFWMADAMLEEMDFQAMKEENKKREEAERSAAAQPTKGGASNGR